MVKKKPLILEDEKIKDFIDMIAPSIIKFNTDHFICGNTYRCVWALREYPTSTSEQAILRHLGEKDGVTLRIYTRQVTPNEEKKIIHNAANKNRMNTANTNDLQQTVTAESNLQDVVTLVSTMHRNREPLLHCAVYIELTASDYDSLKLLQTDVLTELVRSKLNVDRLMLRQLQGFLCVGPTGRNVFGSQYERVLPASSVIPKELFYKVQEEKARRSSLNKSAVTRKANKLKKEKSKFSSKYALTEILVCTECGHPYRRQTWSKYGQKSAVWRCENRLKNGTKASCKHSPTLKEEPLHNAIMTAINNVVENNGDFIGAFRENVIRVIGGYSTKDIPTEYDEQIESLQKEMLALIEENAKQGAVAEDFDNEYKRISEHINELKQAKLKLVREKKQAENYKQKLTEMDSTLKTVRPQVREFDEDLVRRLIKTIKVNKGERLEIQFESGIVMEQMVDYYD